jgi:hypothetical protein
MHWHRDYETIQNWFVGRDVRCEPDVSRERALAEKKNPKRLLFLLQLYFGRLLIVNFPFMHSTGPSKLVASCGLLADNHA